MVRRVGRAKVMARAANRPLPAQAAQWPTPAAQNWKGSSEASVTRADGKSRMDILHYRAEQGFNLGLVHRDSERQLYWEGWVEWMRGSGWRRFGWYVWDQGPGLPGDWNGRLAPSHEFIFHFNRAPRKPHKTVPSKHAGETLGGGGLRGADGTVHRKTGTGNAIQSHRIPDSVFRIMRHKGGLGAAGSHPAVFPVALVEAVLTAYSDPGDLIYEPFCGSGTQIVAAERAGRRCFAMELDPVYCDVAVRRWEMATGRKAMIPSH